MAVIGTFSAAVAQFAAENAIQTRHEKSLMRETDAERSAADLEKRMTLEQLASSQRQTELGLSIAKEGGSLVQNTAQAALKIKDLPEHARVSSALQSGAAHYRDDHGRSLLATELGNHQTVQSVLGDNAKVKLDMIMSGNFDSAEDLRAIGFSDQQAQALLGMKKSGGELTMDERVEFLFSQSELAKSNAQRDQVGKAAEDLWKNFLLQPGLGGAKQAQKTAKGAERAVDDDHQAALRDRKTQSRMSWLATEQLSDAGKMVINKRDQTYKP